MDATVRTVIDWVDVIAPPLYAVAHDPIGLQLGDMGKPVRTVLTTLDVTEEVVQQCVRAEAQLLIAHHPVLFRPITSIRTDRPDGRLLESLIRSGISVYVAHTNYDVVTGGVNDQLAEALGLQSIGVLEQTGRHTLYKLVTYIPAVHAERVRQAICVAGAGTIGNYSGCTFYSEGTGTFLPLDGATPHTGTLGRLEHVREVRLETVVPQSCVHAVIVALREAHPYEEVAYDLWPLEVSEHDARFVYGLGRVGVVPPCRLESLAHKVRDMFGCAHVRVVGDGLRMIEKVAVLGGSGRRAIAHAVARGADVLITGDIDHHAAWEARAQGLALIDAGHHIEDVAMHKMAERLQQCATSAGMDVVVRHAGCRADPFLWV